MITKQSREQKLREQAEGRAEHIAREVLGIDTLETRKSDGLDFHDISVWGLREALTTAYLMGHREARGGSR